MELKYIGHACVQIKSGDDILITDPWFGFNFTHGALHAYPNFSTPTQSELNKVGALHISHLHPDHFCPRSLSYFRRDIPIFITRFRDGVFCRKIRELGFTKIIEIPHGIEGHQWNSIQLSVFAPNQRYPYDSSLVVTVQGKSYLFDNDARFDSYHYIWLGLYFKKFEGICVGYSDIFPFPLCYDYSKCKNIGPSASNHEIQKLMNHESWRRIENICESLKASWVFPYASGMRFLNRDTVHLNKIFLDPNEILNYNTFGAKPVFFQPGDFISIEKSLPRDRTPAITEKDLKPELYTQVVNYDDIEKNRDLLQSRFYNIINKQAEGWPSAISLRIEIITNDNSSLKLDYVFDGNKLESKESTSPDMIVKYPASLILRWLAGEINSIQMHYSYNFVAEIHKVIPRQMAIYHWND